MLAAAIKSIFLSKRLLLILDDVWDLDALDVLDIGSDMGSSVLVTSREALPGAWAGWVGVQLAGENNKAQEEAMLAGYVADDPNTTTVMPHVKVWPD